MIAFIYLLILRALSQCIVTRALESSIQSSSVVVPEVRTIIVTQFTTTNENQALRLFRSILASNNKNDDYVEFHTCIDEEVVAGIDWSKRRGVFSGLGVSFHVQHQRQAPFPIPSSTDAVIDRSSNQEWRNLACLAQVADHISRLGPVDSVILFLSPTFFVVDRLWQSVIAPLHSQLLDGASTSSYSPPTRLSCASSPGITPQATLCDLNLLALNSFYGTELYAFLNATITYPLATAHDALMMAARSLRISIMFWENADYIVYAAQPWTKRVFSSDYNLISLVEIDDDNHKILFENCTIKLIVKSTEYTTDEVLTAKFNALHRNEVTVERLTGCDSIHAENSIETPVPIFHYDDQFSLPKKVRVFDTIIFNDELELLLLRLQVLANIVDHHIIVESGRTFTGAQKPHYFASNQKLFSEYGDKISLVVLDLPFHNPENNSRLIWNNEYASRNAVLFGLQNAGAVGDDIILLSDVDEIPDPRAIENLLSLYHPRKWHRHRIYKLYPIQFMYDFSCYVGTGRPLALTSLTAATLRLIQSLEQFEAGLTNARHFLQSEKPYPEAHVLIPGHWHLSFFGGLDRICSKLRSYSHQEVLEGLSSESTKNTDSTMTLKPAAMELCGHLDEATINNIISKISSGEQIDGKSQQQCQQLSLGVDVLVLAEQWLSVQDRVREWTMNNLQLNSDT